MFRISKFVSMKRILYLMIPAALLVGSCKKNGSFPSTPQISFKSINPGEFHSNDSLSLSIVCGFKDAEGDIQDSVFCLQNSASSSGIWVGYQVPDFPAQTHLQGNIIVQLKSINVNFPTNPGTSEEASFNIYLKDLAGHISDTIQTDTIMLVRD